jgi:predicted GNAT family N-acyltransferase
MRFAAPVNPPILTVWPQNNVLPIMIRLTVIEALTPAEQADCYAIRTEVFCHEQNVSRDLEFDGLDGDCRHYLALLGNLTVGTGRVRPVDGNVVKFERIAVGIPHRGQDIGRALMDRAIADAIAEGVVSAKLNAQVSAGGFYEKLGFVRYGDKFMEAGIEHIAMVRHF